MDYNRYANDFLADLHQKMTPSQWRAFSAMLRGENIFLTGEGGTGKSFVVQAFINYCYYMRINVLAAAQTGLAAQHIGGRTLVKTFGIPVDGPVLKKKTRARAGVLLQNADIVIIDEISMCRIDAFELIIRKLDYVNASREQKRAEIASGACLNVGQKLKPIQVILVGDFFQLPPILTKSEKDVLETQQYHSDIGEGFAFQSPKWHSYCGTGFRTYQLKEVLRQKDPEFIKYLNMARVGDVSFIDYFNANARDKPNPHAIWLFSSNDKANKMNQAYLRKIQSHTFTYYAEIHGHLTENEMPTQRILMLKHGARVMFVKNGPNYTNGQFGTITYLDDTRVTVQLDNGHDVTVGKERWDIADYVVKKHKDEDGYEKNSFEKISAGYFIQIPLRLGYAITIHKSQGQTYEYVNLDPHSFANGMLYVALSRVRGIEGLYLDNDIEESDLMVSVEATRFYACPSKYYYFGRSTHGGARRGSGRKKSSHPTKTMRVPIELENKIKQMVDDWKTDEMEKKIDNNDSR